MFSSLNLEQDKKLAASIGPNARAGSPKAAAAFGEVVLVREIGYEPVLIGPLAMGRHLMPGASRRRAQAG